MSDPLFLAELPDGVGAGDRIEVTGPEGHHAVAAKRLAVGEMVLVADGTGRAVRGVVTGAAASRLEVEVTELLATPADGPELVAVQALAKGDRSDLAVEMLTELGATRILAWQASRSIVRWQGERGARALEKWRTTARAATKQSRRFRVPVVEAATTRQVSELLAEVDLALVLHEAASTGIGDVELPQLGRIAVVVGPEGGISPEELESFVVAGARPVLISDGVLRTSTAGAVALGQISALLQRGRP